MRVIKGLQGGFALQWSRALMKDVFLGHWHIMVWTKDRFGSPRDEIKERATYLFRMSIYSLLLTRILKPTMRWL